MEESKSKLTLASQPEILRATQRDEMFQSILNFDFIEVAELFVKYNIITKYEKEIKLVTDSIYFLLTTGRGFMTLGEEYCQIMPRVQSQAYNRSLSKVVQMSARTKLIFYLAAVFFPYIFNKMIVSYYRRKLQKYSLGKIHF